MEDNPNNIPQVLERAIQSELEGHHFYRMAAQSTDDAKGREVFALLAEEELEHARVLAQWAKGLGASPGDRVPLPMLSNPTPLGGSFPIFSESIRERVADAHFEMTALSVGIQLEATARQFYQEAARSARDPALSKLFGDLADWEAVHYRALLSQQEALKEAYWAASAFAPF